jgi:NodT family efflux transporter outer membrane factor (OMF) lipoprotein
VVAEVAADYIQLRGFQGQIAIARRNLISQQKTADLTRRRQRGGFQTGLDVANADADVASTLSTIPVLEQSAQQTIYALSVLLGTPPATLKNELIASAPIPIIPPEVPIGLPSELLRRRPDIRRAEFQLRAQTAQVGVAVSNLYPKFSLTGTGGFQGGHFSALGNWKDRFWSFGPSIDWPILDFGAIRANIRVQTALEEQNFYLYQKTVLVALEDVESALIAYTEEQQHHAALQAAVAANSKAVDLSTLLYSTGQTDFLNVLTAQRLLFSAETALVQSDTTLATNLVALYKALGGGWEGTDIPSEKTVPPVAPTLNVPIDSTPDRKMN